MFVPSGLFCEVPPPMILLQTSPCDQLDCQNGAPCLLVAEEPLCRCLPGFFGSKCRKMAAVHFLGKDAYVELPGAKPRPTAQISLQVVPRPHTARTTSHKAGSANRKRGDSKGAGHMGTSLQSHGLTLLE